MSLIGLEPDLGDVRSPVAICGRTYRRPPVYRNAHVDTPGRYTHVNQNKVPNHLLVNEPTLSTQGIGGSCGQ
jgi:hypothetical protein